MVEVFTFTKQDQILLEEIKNEEIGTLKLSNKLGIAPKNTINRINKLERYGLLKKEIIGRKRKFSITDKGRVALDNVPSILQIANDMASNEITDITKKNRIIDWRLEAKRK
jgi:predicted transcriptional regulator